METERAVLPPLHQAAGRPETLVAVGYGRRSIPHLSSWRRMEMLVLSRNLGETVQIGGTITLTILAVERGRVRIGIDAPEQVRILRGELVGLRDEAAPEPTLIVSP